MVASVDPTTSAMNDSDHVQDVTTHTVKSLLVDYVNDGTNDAHVRIWLVEEYAFAFVYEFIMSVLAAVEDSEFMYDTDTEWTVGFVRNIIGECIDFAYSEPYAVTDNSPQNLGEKFFAVRNAEISNAEAGTDFFGREDLYEKVKSYGSIEPY